ncbi:MAG TPA: hypothetical protein VLT47_04450 [Anaeromyxobacteraceae bacterium]|nr:hypothetical protein [Anaeromyxobacteraceae bacterium]
MTTYDVTFRGLNPGSLMRLLAAVDAYANASKTPAPTPEVTRLDEPDAPAPAHPVPPAPHAPHSGPAALGKV